MVKVFLSHAAFDSDLAMSLKTALEASVEGVEIFCSSDPTDVPRTWRAASLNSWTLDFASALGKEPGLRQ
jgi:hypothetical protein